MIGTLPPDATNALLVAVAASPTTLLKVDNGTPPGVTALLLMVPPVALPILIRGVATMLLVLIVAVFGEYAPAKPPLNVDATSPLPVGGFLHGEAQVVLLPRKIGAVVFEASGLEKIPIERIEALALALEDGSGSGPAGVL
jgi:hypothetical protein